MGHETKENNHFLFQQYNNAELLFETCIHIFAMGQNITKINLDENLTYHFF